MDQHTFVERILQSRASLVPRRGYQMPSETEAEGGCGVIGLASNFPVTARHLLQALKQMRNRGNGKGGGIAAAGLMADELGVPQATLEKDYLVAIAYLDPAVRRALERNYIERPFEVDHIRAERHLTDFTSLPGLEVRPPEVVEYFVRPKPEALAEFSQAHGLPVAPDRRVEDEFVYQNTYRLNVQYYQSIGDKQAFVLSHGKNMLVLKMVGFGDDVIRYYQIEDLHAHVWIGHHRYPTKGRVWHPGGAHPFIGMNEALVHNGDFANHASISEYLSQRHIYPLFLTDTEVAVQVFDLLHRTYNYPLEYVVEAMAPTTERDFALLPAEKQSLYQMLQQTHIHCSPDGPWFFLIAQSDTHAAGGPAYSLTGITDTSMLRPQVFAWQEHTTEAGHQVAIGLAASEKQGIDAALESLAETDPRFSRRADRYWNARGGSYTDGGAFFFKVQQRESQTEITCMDKFGRPVPMPNHSPAFDSDQQTEPPLNFPDLPANELFEWFKSQVIRWGYPQLQGYLAALEAHARQGRLAETLEQITLMQDRRYDLGQLRRSSVLALLDQTFSRWVKALEQSDSSQYRYFRAGMAFEAPASPSQTAVLEARGFTPEGENSLANVIQKLYELGFKKFLVAFAQGHRFIGNGLGPDSRGVRIDVYGSAGDYLASGADGLEIQVHNNGQDQLAQIMKSGKLVVHGDVGQTFMYAAKGGEVYVLGNAAGRPLINAVGRPRVVINGTCLDYLAESFMAGDPLNGGGFVILNGLTFDEHAQIIELETPYPGGNLFSLASGGAIYVRDPLYQVSPEQLNGGEFVEFNGADWELIKPYLEENARLFDIPVRRLMEVNGEARSPEGVYRKIRPRAVRALMAEESWVTREN